MPQFPWPVRTGLRPWSESPDFGAWDNSTPHRPRSSGARSVYTKLLPLRYLLHLEINPISPSKPDNIRFVFRTHLPVGISGSHVVLFANGPIPCNPRIHR